MEPILGKGDIVAHRGSIELIAHRVIDKKIEEKNLFFIVMQIFL